MAWKTYILLTKVMVFYGWFWKQNNFINNSTVRYESSWEPKTASANVKYGLRNKNVVEYWDLCLIQE